MDGFISGLGSADFQVTVDRTMRAVNENGGIYVAYLFAHDTTAEGIVQAGRYTGNGSAAGPAVELGWEPQFLLLKGHFSGDPWQIIDAARGDDYALYPADDRVEANIGATAINFTSTGFRVGTSGEDFNRNGGSYVFLAIRKPGS